MSEDRFVFVVEWFDSAASLVRNYNLTYYIKDKSIEMYDVKNKRIFLKRCEYSSLQLKDIFIGAVLNIYSRQLKVIDFADQYTRSKFEVQRGKGILIINPEGYMTIGKIINVVQQQGFSITNLKMAKLGKIQAQKFFQQHRGKPFFNDLVNSLSSDFIVALQLLAQNCFNKIKSSINSIEQQFGKNVVYGSQSPQVAAKDIQFFFSNKSTIQTPAYFNNCSCLVIKPHIITQNYVGQIIDAVLSTGFQISAAEMFWLDRPSAEEFLEIYKGVVSQYSQLVQQFTNGPCIALQVRQQNAVVSLRELCGPHDPEMAKTIRPKSIRAVFGKSKGKNAVHCTDLPQDGTLQVQYFFNILQKK